ncbi:hypothetical protein [Streptomyces sp. NRRL B-24720]|uniref:hypothetical protein n=1 Tax=Streptomyces sp. NRRL B-24720 TaxID=1476876 RepID=UPI0004CA6213|nr:hypothetical protein [Streptomyces sp. NRRL B-24720]
MAVTADLGLSASVYQTKSQDLTTTEDQLSFRRGVHLTSGTGAGKADRVFHDQRTLAASSSEDLDLAGVLTDAFGASLTFVRIKGLFISAAATNANNVVVGAAASAPWVTLLNSTGTLTLRPGASFGVMSGVADATGMALTATTADLLKVANSGAGTSVVYDIVIIGASA